MVLSDGGDNASRTSRERAVSKAQESNAVVYTIALDRARHARHQPPAARGAVGSPPAGRSFRPSRAKDLPGILRDIALEIRNTYTIGYTSTNTARDGASGGSAWWSPLRRGGRWSCAAAPATSPGRGSRHDDGRPARVAGAAAHPGGGGGARVGGLCGPLGAVGAARVSRRAVEVKRSRASARATEARRCRSRCRSASRSARCGFRASACRLSWRKVTTSRCSTTRPAICPIPRCHGTTATPRWPRTGTACSGRSRGFEIGDTLRFETVHGDFEYRVKETYIVEPDDIWVLNPTLEPTLTLISCYPVQLHRPRAEAFHRESRAAAAPRSSPVEGSEQAANALASRAAGTRPASTTAAC